MKQSSRITVLFSVIAVVGAGCIPGALSRPIQPAAPAPIAPTPAPVTSVPEVSTDPYEGWGTVMPGGVVSLRIPPDCRSGSAAGSIYVTCPTPDNDQPVPDMQISSDGMQVNIRRWEDLEWEHWDKVIASLKVLTPLNRDIQINIEE